MVRSLLKKVISVFLILTHCFHGVLLALSEPLHTFHVRLTENSEQDFSFHVEATNNRDFSFYDSAIFYDRSLPSQSPWRRSISSNQTTYAFNDHDFFRVDYSDPHNKRLILLGNLRDVLLKIESDWAVLLSLTNATTTFNGLHIQTQADIVNCGRLTIGLSGLRGTCHRLLNSNATIACEGFFSCTTKQTETFNNSQGVLSARTIAIDTGSLLNEKGRLIANGIFDSPIERNQRLQLITPGIHLTAKRLIDHRYGILICGTEVSTVPDFAFPKPKYEQKRFGLDARSGTIITKELSLYDNAWPYFLDHSLFYITDRASLQAQKMNSATAPFALLALKELTIITQSFFGHPYLYTPSVTIQIPYHSDSPVLTFGEQTKIETSRLTLKGLDHFEPKSLLKGTLKVQSLILGMEVDMSDMTIDGSIGALDLRHKNAALKDTKSHDKKIEKVYAKVSDVAVFNRHPSLEYLYIFPKSDTGSVTFHDLSLGNGTIHLVDEHDGRELFLSGNVSAKEISVHSKKQVRNDGKIGAIEETLSAKADSLSITSSSIVLDRGNLDVKELVLAALQHPAHIRRDLENVDLRIEGAGAIFEEPTSFKTLLAKAQAVVFLKSAKGDKADICVDQFIVTANSHDGEQGGILLSEDSSLKMQTGHIHNAAVKVTNGTLSVEVTKKLDITPSFQVSDDGKKMTVFPASVHAERALEISLKPGAELHTVSSMLSSHPMSGTARITLDENAKFATDVAYDCVAAVEEVKQSDLGYMERCLGNGGHFMSVQTNTPVMASVKAGTVEFNGGTFLLKGALLEADRLTAHVSKWKEEASYKEVHKEGYRTDGYGVWSTVSEVKSAQKTPVLTEKKAKHTAIKSEIFEQDAGKNEYEEMVTVLNRSLTPLSRTCISLASMLVANYFGAASCIAGKMGLESMFAKAAMQAFVSQAAPQLSVSGISFCIGDKDWADNITSKDVLAHLFISSLAAGCLGEFGSYLLGKDYDPLKLPSIFKETFSQIDWTKVRQHALLLLAKESEYFVIDTCLRGPSSLQYWSWEECLSRILASEFDSLSSHGARLIGGKYKNGNLSYRGHKGALALVASSTELAKTGVRLCLDSGNAREKPLLHYVSCVLAAGAGASVAEMVAEKVAFGDKSPRELTESREIEALARAASREEKAIFYGKLAGCVPGLLTINEEALSASYMAASNVVDGSFSHLSQNLRETLEILVEQEHEALVKALEHQALLEQEALLEFSEERSGVVSKLDEMLYTYIVKTGDLYEKHEKNLYVAGKVLQGGVLFLTIATAKVPIAVLAVSMVGGMVITWGIDKVFEITGADVWIGDKTEKILQDNGFEKSAPYFKHAPTFLIKTFSAKQLTKGLLRGYKNLSQKAPGQVDNQTKLTEQISKTKPKVDITKKEHLQLVNGRKPINHKYKGKTYHFDKKWLKAQLEGVTDPGRIKELKALSQKYPHGVPFSKMGAAADFSRYAEKKVRIPFSGKPDLDIRAANKMEGWKFTPKGKVWHHHHDGETLMLIDEQLHDAVRHTGGHARFGKNLGDKK